MKLSFRFILLFASLLPAISWAQPTNATGEPPHFVKVTSKASLIHLGSLDSFDITGGGTEAAAMVYEAVTKNDAALAKKAADLYEKIIPNENFGGEYTAMQWLCEYIAGSPEEKKTLMANPIAADWYAYLSQDGFEPLKDYLKKKYHLEEWKNKRTPKSEPKFRFLEDFILFNNPRRERWEKTSKIMEVLNIKKGDVIADIGCGPGYYTFKFSDLVGPSGYVYAVDINPQHIEHVNKLAKQLGVNNVETVLPKSEGLEIAKKADLAYLCSLYHNIYALDTDEERDKFMNGVKNSLKPDGTLVVVDNGIVQDSLMPYHGPHISKDLIINQLWYYGLKLVGSYQFIPQRYVLVFKKIPGPEPK